MKAKKLIATVAVSAVLLSGCSFRKTETIVKVNNVKITQAQFDKMFDKAVSNNMFAQMGIDVKKDKNSFIYLMIKDRVINELIVKELIDEEMAKRHIRVTKKDAEEEFKNIIDKVGSKEKFDEILKQHNVSASQFKEDLEDEIKMKKLVSALDNITVSDAEARKFYKENIAKFKYPEKVRASHILISANPEEIKEVIKSERANKNLSEAEINAKVDKEILIKSEKAEKILNELRKDPTTFEAVAVANSDDTVSAKQGGDLGFFAKQEMVEPFSKAAFSLKPNTLSGIVKTPYGFHIIMVTDRKAAGQESFERVQNEIKNYLMNQKQVKILENLIESLKKQAKIEYVNEEYSPKAIQESLKKQAKAAPALKEEINEAEGSAAPAVKPAKK